MEILGYLAAGLPSADHEYLPRRQLIGVAVLRRVQLHNARGQPLGHPRRQRHLVRPGREHDLLGGQLAVARGDPIAPLGLVPQPGRGDALGERDIEELHIVLDITDDVLAHHEALGIVPLVREAGQLTLPVRRYQTEGVPAPVSPITTRAVPLEHDVVDPRAREVVAHRQPRLPAADHHHSAVRAIQLGAHRSNPSTTTLASSAVNVAAVRSISSS